MKIDSLWYAKVQYLWSTENSMEYKKHNIIQLLTWVFFLQSTVTRLGETQLFRYLIQCAPCC